MKTVEKDFSVRIKKGKHSPSIKDRIGMILFCLNSEEVDVRLSFENIRYDQPDHNIPDKDEDDWMKGFGSSKHLLPTIKKVSSLNYKPTWWKKLPFGCCWVGGQHRDSQRLVFRYNEDKDLLQYTKQYIYKDCQRILPKESTVTSVPASEGETNLVNLSSMGYFWLHPYFGGNQKAPIDMNIVVTIIKKAK